MITLLGWLVVLVFAPVLLVVAFYAVCVAVALPFVLAWEVLRWAFIGVLWLGLTLARVARWRPRM